MSARKYTSEVKNYIFSSFSEESKNTEKYSFQAIHIDGISSKVLAKEHQSALSQGFSIGEEIKKQRGHAQYEMDQYTLKISQEVDKKIQE